MKQSHWRPLAAFVPFALVSRDAAAYLDPSSGTLLFQVLIAGVVGSALFFKTSWMKARILFSKLTGSDKGTDTKSDSQG